MLKSTKAGDKLSSIFGSVFGKLPLSPNVYTGFSLLFGLMGAYSVFIEHMYYACVCFFLAFFLDGVDGAVARAKNMVSKRGAYIDGITDRLVETIFLISLLGLKFPEIFVDMKYWIALNLAFGTYMTSFARAYADHREAMSKANISRIPGLLERGERVTIYFIALLIYLRSPYYSALLLIVAAVLAIITSIQRIIFVIKHAEKELEHKLSDKVKQVIVVRADLKMGKGKLAAQAAHASVEAFLKAEESAREAWLKEGQKKVVLKVKSEKELLELYDRARKAHLSPVLIRDAGRTQLKKGTITCLGVGPDIEEKLNSIFGGLKLL